jgi:hypothetical protein
MQVLAQVIGWVVIALVATAACLLIMLLALAIGAQLILIFFGGA